MCFIMASVEYGSRHSQVHLAYTLGFCLLAVCWTLVLTKKPDNADIRTRVVQFPTSFIVKVFLYLIPFSHKVDVKVCKHIFPLNRSWSFAVATNKRIDLKRHEIFGHILNALQVYNLRFFPISFLFFNISDGHKIEVRENRLFRCTSLINLLNWIILNLMIDSQCGIKLSTCL